MIESPASLVLGPTLRSPTRASRLTSRLPAVIFLAVAGVLLLRSHVYFAPRRVALAKLPLTALDGSPVSPETTRGKAVLLNFWAPWCGPCRREFPTLNHLQQEFPQAVVIGIEDDPDQYPQAQALAHQASLSYLLLQTTPNVRATFGNVAMLPTTLYITPSGRVLHTVSGVIPERLMRRYFEDAVAAP